MAFSILIRHTMDRVVTGSLVSKPFYTAPGSMPNRLCHELSPYLLQHAGNPVDWRPWNAEALTLARTEQKPIFLSIGYASCHWCHVMAHETLRGP